MFSNSSSFFPQLTDENKMVVYKVKLPPSGFWESGTLRTKKQLYFEMSTIPEGEEKIIFCFFVINKFIFTFCDSYCSWLFYVLYFVFIIM